MCARSGIARKIALPLLGAPFLVLVLLALLFPVLQPGQSRAHAKSDELWFTVTFQGGGDFNVTGDLRFDFLSYLDPISVYRDGTAYAEFTQSEDSVRINSVFEGRYDKKTKTLTGDYESSYISSEPGVGEYTETFTGALEGTLEYREDEYSDGELVDTIFTMKGNIRCRGVAEYTDLDGYGDDESYVEDLEIDYDFVANGNTGPEAPGDDETGGGGEGSKIPGPGSWWQWLTGTVVAGAVAAGTGLINSLFGGAPPAPPTPPQQPVTDWVTDRKKPPGLLEEGVLELTVENIKDELKKPFNWFLDKGGTSIDYLRSLMSEPADKIEEAGDRFKEGLKGTGDYVRSGEAGDGLVHMPDRMLELKDKLEKMAGAQENLDAIRKAMNDPMGFLEQLSKGNKELLTAAAEALEKDPWLPLKFILGTDLWEQALDHNNPLHVRLGYSALATINTVGLIEWGMGAKSLLGGADDAARFTDDIIARSGDDVVETRFKTGPLRRKRPAVKAPKTGANILNEADRASMPAIWGDARKEAEATIERFKNAKTPALRRKAMLEIQGDDLSKIVLDGKDPELISAFNKELARPRMTALEQTRLQIAIDEGVDPSRVRVFKATNKSSRVKVSMDEDFTVYILQADGTEVGVPSAKVQGIYDQKFYEAVGEPKGVTPKQLGKACRNTAVNTRDAEAYGSSLDDFEKLQKGELTRDPTQVARTITYKADEEFALADKLFKEGKIEAGMKKQLVGMRETGKQFNSQIRSRARILRGQFEPGSEEWKWLDSRLGDVEDTVSEMNGMIARGESPREIEAFLKTKNTTPEKLAKKVGDLYEDLADKTRQWKSRGG